MEEEEEGRREEGGGRTKEEQSCIMRQCSVETVSVRRETIRYAEDMSEFAAGFWKKLVADREELCIRENWRKQMDKGRFGETGL